MLYVPYGKKGYNITTSIEVPDFWALIHVKTRSLQTIIVRDFGTSKAAYLVESKYQDKWTDGIILPEDSVVRGVQDPLNAMQWELFIHPACTPDLLPCNGHILDLRVKSLQRVYFDVKW